MWRRLNRRGRKQRGKIIGSSITIDDLKEKEVTNGDGLYKDIYGDNRYVYKGANLDNYINLIENFGVFRL